MDTCLYREQRGSPGHPPWYYCQMRARQVRPDHDCRTDACRTLAAIAAKSARKEEPAMSEPIRRLKWDAPASQADPEFTDELRKHVRRMVASIAEQLDVAPVTVTGALRRQSKPGAAAPAPQPSQPAAAAPQPAATAAPAALAPTPAAPAVAPSDDWCVARDLVAHANPDELAEFFAAYDLSDRFDAFVTGLRRPRRSA